MFQMAWISGRNSTLSGTYGTLGFPREFSGMPSNPPQAWQHSGITLCCKVVWPFALVAASWDNDFMPNATISVDAALKERLADLASQSGQRVDEFVEALLRRIANADIRFDRGVPVFPRRPGAPTLSVKDVDHLADGTGE